MTSKPLFPGDVPRSLPPQPGQPPQPAVTADLEGQLAGWADAAERETRQAPERYREIPSLHEAWRRGYGIGREAFLTAWEKDLFVKARFQKINVASRAYAYQPHWLVPLAATLGEPVAYLEGDGPEPKAILVGVPTTGLVSCFEVYANGRRIAAIAGDFWSALQCAAQLVA